VIGYGLTDAAQRRWPAVSATPHPRHRPRRRRSTRKDPRSDQKNRRR
jgi:hypothetical protein